MKQLLGAHTSIAGGLHKAIQRAKKLKFNAIQIFTKNNNRWQGKELTDEDIKLFNLELKDSKIDFICAHDSYLINLCAKDKSILTKSRKAFVDELFRCQRLNIPYLNFHPGAHLGQGEKEGIKIIAESLNLAHESTPKFNVSSMIETTAGQGTNLGKSFEEIASIIDLVQEKSRISVCIDTAHIFAAGYDISTYEGFDKTIEEFDKIIGLERLKCIHVNDSKKELGSRVDRHEHLGKGFIGSDGFAFLMNDKRLEKIPKILETPKGKEQLEDLENIKFLKKLTYNIG